MIIETRQLSKKFGRFDAVDNLNLRVPEGSVFALIGPNGAGKTTTIRLLMNLLRPDRGDVTVLGTPAHRLSAGDFQRIGYVSESQKLPDALTLAQYFDYLRSLYPAWDRDLESELWRLQANYKDEHPEVKRAKKRIEIFENAIGQILK